MGDIIMCKNKILMITDRLHDCARGLKDYLESSADMTVDLISDVKEMPKKKHYDFLIIVGYLENSANYYAMSKIKKHNDVKVIFYALDSIYIDYLCKKHGIVYRFDRTRPMEKFMQYMRQIHLVLS